MKSASGTSRHFAGPQNLVAIGGIADIGPDWQQLARSLMTQSATLRAFEETGCRCLFLHCVEGEGGGEGGCSSTSLLAGTPPPCPDKELSKQSRR